MFLKFFVDESYNRSTFNVGGWLAEESEWDRLEAQWSKRIEHERKKHGKFDRYHASDCASGLRDYKGWTDEEKIVHVKKLQAIISRRNLYAICWGLNFNAMLEIFNGDRELALQNAYNLAFQKVMVKVYRVVKRGQGHRVAIIHDRTTGRDHIILNAFNALLATRTKQFRFDELFTTIAPMSWKDCIMLQPADMIAYDSFRIVDSSIHRPNTSRVRKSLAALIGRGVKLSTGYWGEAELRKCYSPLK